MHIILLLANLALVLTFSLLLLSLLKVRNLPAYLVGLYLVAYADIVLVLEAASLMSLLNRFAVLSLQVLLTIAMSILWLAMGRPQLLASFARLRFRGRPLEWLFAVKLISVALVAVGVAYVYLRDAEMILAIVPNNYDSLTYHLSRVGYWLQYHSLYPWPTPNPRQTTFPMNAELGIFWTVLWWGTDRLAGFVQWTTVPVIMLSSYGLTRLLGYSKWSASMTALLWATLTQVIFQAASTQNDLVTSAFWIATVYFFFLGAREKHAAYAWLSGLAFGLAMGTKGTSFLVLPGFCMGILVMLLMKWRHRDFRQQFVHWTAACSVGFLLLGSYIYIQNAIAFGHFLGPSTANTGIEVALAEGGFPTYASRLRDNLGRYAYQSVDFSPLPDPWPAQMNPAKAAIFSKLFRLLRIRVENPETIATPHFDLQYINPLNDDRSWFGPLAVFLIAAVIAQAYQGLRELDAQRFALLSVGLGFAVVESAMEAWTPYKGRYFMIPLAVLFPLMGCLVQPRDVWRAVLTLCLVALGMTTMFVVTLDIPALTNIGVRDALSASRKKIEGPEDFEVLLVMKNIPTNASIGLTGGGNFPDYPFFGEDFTHYVTLFVGDGSAVWPRGGVERYVADFQHSDYLFLRSETSASALNAAPADFDLLSSDSTLSTWIRSPLRSADECDGDKWPFRDFFQLPDDPVICPRFPFVPARAPGAGPGPVNIPRTDDKFIPVIAAGDAGSMKFDLLAKGAARARISVRVDPQGYTVPQSLRLELSQVDSIPQVFEAPFDSKGVVRFNVPLAEGTYRAKLGLAASSLEVRILGIQIAAP